MKKKEMKKRIIFFYPALLAASLFFACNSNFTDLNWPSEIGQQVSAKPSASIFATTPQINISWPEHKNAVRYELYKDTQYNGSFSEKIDSGRELSYTDLAITDNKFCFYRLKAISDITNYDLSAVASGLYSSTADAITNTSVASASAIDKETSYAVPFYTFFNGMDVKRTTLAYYSYNDTKSGMVLSAELTTATTFYNSIIYIQLLNNSWASARYPLMMGDKSGKVKISLPQKNGTLYIAVTSDTVNPVLTEDTGTFTLKVTNENLSKKNVNASADGNHIDVSWPEFAGEERYDIYRNTNGGDFIFIGTVTEKASYEDHDVTADGVYRYYLVIYNKDGNGNYSTEESNLSNEAYLLTNEYMIDGSLKASVLQFNNSIHLQWNPVSGVSGYNVYKYASKMDANPVFFTVATNSFNDSACTPNIPYFYKVACLANGREYLQNGYFAFGLCSDSIDCYESGNGNDDISKIAGEGSTLFDTATPPIIYSVTDGAGGTIKDRDFYKYHGPVTQLFAQVWMPEGSPFGNGELTLRWYYKNTVIGPLNICSTTDMNDPRNQFSFADFGIASGDVDVYCEISINTATGTNKVGKYYITISNGL